MMKPPLPLRNYPITREEWLMTMANLVEKLFIDPPAWPSLPKYRISCGWPSKRAVHCYHPRLAECHSPTSSKGGYYEIFISPIMEDSIQVAGTIVHELCHVLVGVEVGHGAVFRELARAVGLTEGTASNASPGAELTKYLQTRVSKIGIYPHQAVIPSRAKRGINGRDSTPNTDTSDQ